MNEHAQQALEPSYELNESVDGNGCELSDEELEAIAGGKVSVHILFTVVCVDTSKG
jgi:bacteriocin-like protein